MVVQSELRAKSEWEQLSVFASRSEADKAMTKILVIEDEAMLREEVVDWLTFEGYEAVGAEDGLAGVEQAAQHLPDLIVCDITMPRLDGYGVLLEIHANPTTADIPF